uniref:Claudin n=1 Tax=Chelonoidis abingdonii TaxID=106734 RepID=A0A8C0H0T1_CHEAB
MAAAVEAGGFFLGTLGWGLLGVTLPNSYWRVSTVDGSVITTSTLFENLWQSCATDSTGVYNCREFPSMLALSGKRDPLPAPCAPSPLESRDPPPRSVRPVSEPPGEPGPPSLAQSRCPEGAGSTRSSGARCPQGSPCPDPAAKPDPEPRGGGDCVFKQGSLPHSWERTQVSWLPSHPSLTRHSGLPGSNPPAPIPLPEPGREPRSPGSQPPCSNH